MTDSPDSECVKVAGGKIQEFGEFVFEDSESGIWIVLLENLPSETFSVRCQNAPSSLHSWLSGKHERQHLGKEIFYNIHANAGPLMVLTRCITARLFSHIKKQILPLISSQIGVLSVNNVLITTFVRRTPSDQKKERKKIRINNPCCWCGVYFAYTRAVSGVHAPNWRKDHIFISSSMEMWSSYGGALTQWCWFNIVTLYVFPLRAYVEKTTHFGSLFMLPNTYFQCLWADMNHFYHN